MNSYNVSSGERTQALTASTLSFTVCFAVWTMFSIIGMKIKAELGLNDTEFAILVATPILTGSLSRIFLGVWTDQYGGRKIFTIQMIVTAIAAYLLTMVSTYPMFLVAALGVGLAGGSFAVGIAYVSKWYPKEKQGTALGIFGMGNVGAAVTNFGAPFLLIAMGGWEGVAQVYSIVLLITAILFFLFTKDDPALKERKEKNIEHVPFIKQLEPLKNMQVWRFSLYYFFVFGAFVALALWLPRYYVGAYGLELTTAGMLAACYALPGSIFRALGGWLSDKYGARAVMYWTFIACILCTFILSYPNTQYTIDAIGDSKVIKNVTIVDGKKLVIREKIAEAFTALGNTEAIKNLPETKMVTVEDLKSSLKPIEGIRAIYNKKKNIVQIITDKTISFSFGIPLALFVFITIILGFFMSLGKAAVYKHIPVYYPDHVGSVGGIVGLVGGLGGFFLPISFGIMNDLIGVWTSCFMLLTILISVALVWMHFSILRMEQKQNPELHGPKYLPELANDESSTITFLENEAINLRQRAKELEQQGKDLLKKKNDSNNKEQ